jgi:membrane protease subunit HflK
MYLETMQQVYANTSKVMVDAKGQGNLLYAAARQADAAAGRRYRGKRGQSETAVRRGAVQPEARRRPTNRRRRSTTYSEQRRLARWIAAFA